MESTASSSRCGPGTASYSGFCSTIRRCLLPIIRYEFTTCTVISNQAPVISAHCQKHQMRQYPVIRTTRLKIWVSFMAYPMKFWVKVPQFTWNEFTLSKWAISVEYFKIIRAKLMRLILRTIIISQFETACSFWFPTLWEYWTKCKASASTTEPF